MTQKESILFRLTELMFQKQQTFLLLDELYEDEIIGSSIRNIQIDSPFQQLLFEGVLSQYIIDDSVSISFTVEAYFQYLLGLHLYYNKDIDKPKLLTNLITNNSLAGLNNGVANYLVNHVQNKNYGLLMDCIDYPEIPIEICIQALMQMFFVKGETFTLDLMLNNPTTKDWNTLDLTLKVLVNANHFTLVEKIIKQILLLSIDVLRLNRSIFDVGLMFYNTDTLSAILNEALTEKKDNRNLICKCYYLLGNYNEIIANIENESFDKYEFMDLLNYSGALIDTGQSQKAVNFIQDKLLPSQVLTETVNFKKSKMLAIALHETGKSEEALAEISKTIDSSFKYLGRFHMFNCELLNTSGLIKLSLEMFTEAEEMFNMAYKNCLAIVGEYHHETGIAVNNMSLIYFYQNDFNKAIEMFSKSLDISQHCFGISHPETARIHRNLAVCYKKIENWQSSVNQNIIAAEIFKEANSINDPNIEKIIKDLKIVHNDNPFNSSYPAWILELLNNE